MCYDIVRSLPLLPRPRLGLHSVLRLIAAPPAPEPGCLLVQEPQVAGPQETVEEAQQDRDVGSRVAGAGDGGAGEHLDTVLHVLRRPDYLGVDVGGGAAGGEGAQRGAVV